LKRELICLDIMFFAIKKTHDYNNHKLLILWEIIRQQKKSPKIHENFDFKLFKFA